MSLTLSLGEYRVAIARPYVMVYDPRVVFLDGNDDTGTVEYSSAGTPRILGSPRKYLWTLQAILTGDQLRSLQGMQSYQRHLESQNQAAFAVRFYDQIREAVDHGPRQRAIAPNTLETPIPGGGVAYYAQYAVRLGFPLATPQKNHHYPWRVDWQMSELEAIAP